MKFHWIDIIVSRLNFQDVIEKIREGQIMPSIKPLYESYYIDEDIEIERFSAFFDAYNFSNIDILKESQWKNSGIDDWWYRVDPENKNTGTARHIHIARGKHRNSIPQYSWDVLYKRHDTHKFKEPVPSKAKLIAGRILGLDTHLLEVVTINKLIVHL
ncbi:hypothetical protein EHQ13_11465 [Leptospira gomenensis]|uniref:Uncharacterized protein n=1 Tax=Leptospira gomenensis TaxID=2484974 RepID=A0A5F1YBU4_9LEPT|nr:DUF6367 family protein [Leptospira gomenensis]TGK33881.1 hypothetical protein EHQ17_10295 [Leptospira gomenensis]TGK52106.1 hypothetical protein EHQ07_00590 [Leptospira gomenensis]TGK59845.1 hypothetical protein EHQ13_11465 [Leptospira gomenensis]